jgi:hypothetical protein
MSNVLTTTKGSAPSSTDKKWTDTNILDQGHSEESMDCVLVRESVFSQGQSFFNTGIAATKTQLKRMTFIYDG